ncbi:MAG: hypothetical protein E7540_06595 [Ruminococcaceae bacterium]|nr:hypothetical protein [Oscillospiraceae bacterium]
MTELTYGFIGVIVGAVLSGLFSLFTTQLLVRGERQTRYRQWLKEQIIQTYLGLAHEISKNPISVLVDECDNSIVLDSAAYKIYSKKLYDYITQHSGEFELFLSKEIKAKIVKLNGCLYKIASSNEKLIFDINSFQNKKGIIYEIEKIKSELIYMLQEDIKV